MKTSSITLYGYDFENKEAEQKVEIQFEGIFKGGFFSSEPEKFKVNYCLLSPIFIKVSDLYTDVTEQLALALGLEVGDVELECDIVQVVEENEITEPLFI